MAKKTWKIMGKYKGLAVERVDSASSEEEARYLLNEYRIAFGEGWTLWIE